MIWLRVLVLSIAFVSESYCRKPRIINGNDANIENFPYQASIRINGIHYCGGTIISEKHILTVGHCASADSELQPPYDTATVNTGTSRRNEIGHAHKIYKATLHPNYRGDKTRAFNDIAIITLKGTIIFNKYQQKINLPQQNFRAGQKVYLTGWGFIQQNPIVRPNQLQWLQTELISRAECQRRVTDSKKRQILDTEVCTNNSRNSGMCAGDSGGPITANGEIVGIASWTFGFHCGAGATDVYTNVYKFKNFIESVIYSTSTYQYS